MANINGRLRKAREKLGVSQEYVARAIGIGRSAVAQIELGKRKVSTDELSRFCRLYHLSADYLIGEETSDDKQQVFARGFSELNESDQQEILNLISFKKAMTSQEGA